MDFASKIVFWVSLAGLFYTFAGYPLLMAILARCTGRRSAPASDSRPAQPTVTVVLVARNEENRIARRIENLLSGSYPGDKLDILLVIDGSTDATARIASEYSDPRVRVLEVGERSGKASCLSRAAAAQKGEVVVFADARQRFAEDTIPRLVSWFADPKIGAVSGNLSIEKSGSSVGKGVDAYWKLERAIREWESRFDSSIGCTGAVYAVRGALFSGIPGDTILDDVVIPMLITLRRYRVIFDRQAEAFDPQTLEPEKERIRKRRTLAGNLQMLFRYPEWLLPWRNRLWWQLISHKYLRLAAPLLLVAMFFSNFLAAHDWPYIILFVGQTLFVGLAILGLAMPGMRKAWLSIPSGFIFLNWMVVEAAWQFLFVPKDGWWNSAKTAEKPVTAR